MNGYWAVSTGQGQQSSGAIGEASLGFSVLSTSMCALVFGAARPHRADLFANHRANRMKG